MNEPIETPHGAAPLDIQVATIAYCWGIDLAMKRIADSSGEGELQATHRWSPKPEARRWDPLELVRRQDPDLLAHYPGLERVKVVDKLSDVTASRLALGHHGTVEPLPEAGGATVHDFTCPFIANSEHRAHVLAEAGFDLILFGKPGNHHCEYAKSAAEAKGRTGIIGEAVANLLPQIRQADRNWACLGQVTANIERWAAFKNDLQGLDIPVHIVDTVCSDSFDRQNEGLKLARACDVVILVNDHGGSTLSLYEVCRAANPNTYRHDHLANEGIKPEWLAGARSVAILGGIHVPKWILDEVGAGISRLHRMEIQP